MLIVNFSFDGVSGSLENDSRFKIHRTDPTKPWKSIKNYERFGTSLTSITELKIGIPISYPNASNRTEKYCLHSPKFPRHLRRGKQEKAETVDVKKRITFVDSRSLDQVEMRVGTIQTLVVLATALFAVRLHGAQHRIRTWIQAHATVDPCKFSIPQSETVGEWKCRKAFSLLDQLPPGEVPIPCQKLMRREDGGPRCRDSPEGVKKCSVKGGVFFLRRLLQPEVWEVGERNLYVTFSYCIEFLGHREPDVPLSRSTDLVRNYLYPSSGGSVHRTVTRTGKQLVKIHLRALQTTEGMK